ncbi:MAG TPA: RNA 2',3'-cyclic phosphodiesterase, partial [candidate division Zixibacteria bacterium]|nr:RNA 2',3'-cyclic phosphodiesterase [candidate division Zixibacteria bacterium]
MADISGGPGYALARTRGKIQFPSVARRKRGGLMANSEMIRTFIAMEIPVNIQTAIDREITAKLRGCDVRCSWVKPHNIHLTLKFLGDTPEKRIGSIAEDIAFVLEGIAPVKLRLDGAGTFGGKSPQVVWAGLSGETEAVELIAKTIDSATLQHGFKKEKRRFSPHLTVGRIRNPKGAEELISKIRELKIEPVE